MFFDFANSVNNQEKSTIIYFRIIILADDSKRTFKCKWPLVNTKKKIFFQDVNLNFYKKGVYRKCLFKENIQFQPLTGTIIWEDLLREGCLFEVLSYCWSIFCFVNEEKHNKKLKAKKFLKGRNFSINLALWQG